MADKHYPGQDYSDETLAKALYLERQYWENMSIATANGIAQALNG